MSEPQIFPVTKKMLWRLVELEQKQECFTVEGAIASYLYDLNRGKPLGQTDYENIWGWTRKKVRYNWDHITTTAELILASATRRSKAKNEADELGPLRGHSGAINDAIGAQEGTIGATQGPRRGQHTKEYTNNTNLINHRKNLNNDKGSAPREVERARGKKFVRPSLKEAQEYFDYLKLASGLPYSSADEAQAFIDHYDSNGWRVGGRSAMKDWRASVRNWTRNIKQRNYDLKYGRNGSSKPKATPVRGTGVHRGSSSQNGAGDGASRRNLLANEREDAAGGVVQEHAGPVGDSAPL